MKKMAEPIILEVIAKTYGQREFITVENTTDDGYETYDTLFKWDNEDFIRLSKGDSGRYSVLYLSTPHIVPCKFDDFLELCTYISRMFSNVPDIVIGRLNNVVDNKYMEYAFCDVEHDRLVIHCEDLKEFTVEKVGKGYAVTQDNGRYVAMTVFNDREDVEVFVIGVLDDIVGGVL